MERPIFVWFRRRVFDAHRKAAPGAGHSRCIEPARDAFAVERRRHDDQAQIRSQRSLHIERERCAKIAGEMAFVKFVEQDRADAGQFRIGLDHARENAFGHDLHARARGNLCLEADAIADAFADVFAQLRSHELRRRARGDAARFQHDDLVAAQPIRIEQSQRYLRRLARTGWRFQHQAWMSHEVCQDFRQYVPDWKLCTFHHRINNDPATRAGSSLMQCAITCTSGHSSGCRGTMSWCCFLLVRWTVGHCTTDS